ncbi:Aspergillopepsin-1 [Fulvia fulva]|uniref:Aspergillopepsin-1 n=1 Tax=Passalora fulva TaxID=5499 RepID=A0A9Q8LFJ9_PASFU|nr:Aspergillopepsin-1 [Fulvia fulva]KAK4626213.1 Aspergillopepsin-1 [Fulvia fulva]KAK4627960.1 Aspergillopepsin-1 [Fulvia fulva]UJO16480.1 Aspergillopepsin-1 [Fulvia fulva]WPV13361.1 Aspergillopepsin-1 [Fulvia fulva]WPV28131.1 Aspergillopepsin-1 [Fulvia fulva]
MDTGTTLALIDDDSCRAIYAAIPGSKYDADQGGFVFPANTPREKLPVLKVAIGDCECVVDPDDVGFADVGGGMMFGGWQSRGNMAFSIFGGSLLKSMYAIFDQGGKRFGWVQREDLQGKR